MKMEMGKKGKETKKRMKKEFNSIRFSLDACRVPCARLLAKSPFGIFGQQKEIL
jgi:hypothetical protein